MNPWEWIGPIVDRAGPWIVFGWIICVAGVVATYWPVRDRTVPPPPAEVDGDFLASIMTDLEQLPITSKDDTR